MRKTRKGFTLTEILVAMAIFALGGVSIVGLFIANMKMSRNAMDASRAAEIMRNVRALVTSSLSRPIALRDDYTVYRFDYPGASLKFKPKDLTDRESTGGSTTAATTPEMRRQLFGNVEDNVLFFALPAKEFDVTLITSEDARRQMMTSLPNDGLSRTGDRRFTGVPPEVYRLVPDTLRSSGVIQGHDFDDRPFYSFDFSIRRGVSRSSAPLEGGGTRKAPLDDLYVVHIRIFKGFEFASDYDGQAQQNKPFFEWDFMVAAAK
ncbi:type II secretion system protein [bacterium]|nr:MAG: type II secretion system protein [bacterium]RIK61531.1 MAG: hypothetical protein DCC64_13095 [Planctomycetota bacterium]